MGWMRALFLIISDSANQRGEWWFMQRFSQLIGSSNANMAVERHIVQDILKTLPRIVTKRTYAAQQKAWELLSLKKASFTECYWFLFGPCANWVFFTQALSAAAYNHCNTHTQDPTVRLYTTPFHWSVFFSVLCYVTVFWIKQAALMNSSESVQCVLHH